MSFIEIVRPYAELGYFIAGIFLAIAAVFGLYQIWISKSDIEWKKKRAALEKAMEYSKSFNTSYTQLIKAFDKSCDKQGIYLGGYQDLGEFKNTSVDPENDQPEG